MRISDWSSDVCSSDLPANQDGVPLRHAVEVRHESFLDLRFIALMREAGVAVVFADKPKYPQIADITTDFVYARLRDAREEEAERTEERRVGKEGGSTVRSRWTTVNEKKKQHTKHTKLR